MAPETSAPLVSVVTPSYNQADFIEDTIRSVAGQDYPSVEHLVIDAESDDGTVAILRRYEDRYNLRWSSEPDRGQSHALNKGFSRARGAIVGWLNADDVYLHPGVFEGVAKTFDRHSEVDVVYSHFGRLNRSGTLTGIRAVPNFSRERLKRVSFLPQCTAFFRRPVVERHDVDESLVYTMDIDYFLRIARQHTFRRRHDVHACFRFHEDSLTKQPRGELDSDFHRELDRLRETYPPAGGFSYVLGRSRDKLRGLVDRVRGYVLYRRLLNRLTRQPDPFPFISLP